LLIFNIGCCEQIKQPEYVDQSATDQKQLVVTGKKRPKVAIYNRQRTAVSVEKVGHGFFGRKVCA
jgi:hypothetical protein